MNDEAIQYLLDNDGYTYRETNDGFHVLEPLLQGEHLGQRHSPLGEIVACEASIVHRPLGFEIVPAEDTSDSDDLFTNAQQHANY